MAFQGDGHCTCVLVYGLIGEHRRHGKSREVLSEEVGARLSGGTMSNPRELKVLIWGKGKAEISGCSSGRACAHTYKRTNIQLLSWICSLESTSVYVKACTFQMQNPLHRMSGNSKRRELGFLINILVLILVHGGWNGWVDYKAN